MSLRLPPALTDEEIDLRVKENLGEWTVDNDWPLGGYYEGRFNDDVFARPMFQLMDVDYVAGEGAHWFADEVKAKRNGDLGDFEWDSSDKVDTDEELVLA